MKLVKSLLLGSAATLAVVAGANAADLPSKKAAPASYVKICDAYGAGFFYIPGTDTCVKLGGYVRAEYQYVPGQKTYNVNAGNAAALIQQFAGAQDSTGYETRGRIDVDARTPTAMGTARTFIRLRLASTSGIRNTTISNFGGTTNAAAGGGYGMSAASATAPTIESAMVQWAGFTFGIGPENYAMMPTFMYNSNVGTGFPNGMKQIAYTATFSGGWSATLALEDMRDQNNSQTAFDQPATAAELVGNIRLDQAWGFAAIHGMVGNDSVASNGAGIGTVVAGTPGGLPALPAGALATGQSTFTNYAIGATVSFKLPMIAAGDQVWITANYANGMLGALYSAGGLSNGLSTSSDHRLLGGVIRVDTDLQATSATTVGTVTGWNIGANFVHYWAPQWRSNFAAEYLAITPPTAAANAGLQWGNAKYWTVSGSLIYSPAKDLDIGLEMQYANLKSNLQNAAASAGAGYIAAGMPGLSVNNVTTKLRVERTF